MTFTPYITQPLVFSIYTSKCVQNIVITLSVKLLVCLQRLQCFIQLPVTQNGLCSKPNSKVKKMFNELEAKSEGENMEQGVLRFFQRLWRFL